MEKMIKKRLGVECAVPKGLCSRWLMMIMCFLLYVGTAQASVVVLTDAEIVVRFFSDSAFDTAPQAMVAIAAVNGPVSRYTGVDVDEPSAGVDFPVVTGRGASTDNAIRGPSDITERKTSLITIIHRLH